MGTYYGRKEKRAKKFKFADIKLFMVGLVFFVCGLLSFVQGLGFMAEWDMAQLLGMGITGLIFMGVGGAVAYFLGIKGK